MPIHTVAPAKGEYIRITENMLNMNGDVQKGSVGRVISRGGLPANLATIGSVGKVTGRIAATQDRLPLVVAEIAGHGERIFNVENTELITEKEYFKGVLRGR